MNPFNPRKNHEIRGLILAIVSTLCFSATSLLLGYLGNAHEVDGWVASAYRAAIGLVVIVMMQGTTGTLHLKHIITNRLLFMRGLIGGVTIPVYYISIMELGPGRAGLISGSYPLFAAVFAAFLLRENLKRSYFAHITIALIGLFAIFADNGIGKSKFLYDVLAIMGAAAGGLCVVMIRHLRHSETTSTIFASQCIFTLVMTFIVAGDRLFISNVQALGLTVLAAVTVIGAQLALTESFRHITVAKGSTLQMLTPALTVLSSAVLLCEHISLLEIIGGTAILFASFRIVVSR